MDGTAGAPSESSKEWIVGVVLCVAGAAVSSLGLNLQKYSHFLNDLKRPSERSTYIRQWRWLFGFAVFTIGQLLNISSAGFAPQAMMAALGSLSLVTNGIFATYFFGEKFGKRDAAATLVIFTGSTLAVVYGPHVSQRYTTMDLEILFQEHGFWVYLVVSAGVLLMCACRAVYARRTGTSLGALLYALVAAVVGAFSFLFGKISVQLLKSTIEGTNQFNNPITFLFVLTFIAFAVSNVHFLNMGLKNADAMVMVPMYYVMNSAWTVVEGILYFETWTQFSQKSAVLFGVGEVLTLVGVAFLGGKDARKDADTPPPPQGYSAISESDAHGDEPCVYEPENASIQRTPSGLLSSMT